MGKNIQHLTFNAQCPTHRCRRGFFGCWALNVECWAFSLLAFNGLSLFAQPSTNALPALAPPYGEIPPTFWEQHGTTILAGGVALIALAALILWKVLQPKPPVTRPPEIVAREALTALLRQPEDGKLLSEVSQILRRYVITAFELPAAELTTTEFCAALAGTEKIGAELAQIISGFLRECDVRKFSAAVRSPAFMRLEPPEGGTPHFLSPLNAATRALELISLAEKRLTSVGRASSRAGLDGSSVASPNQDAATQ